MYNVIGFVYSRYNYFIDQQTIKDSQCMVMAHYRPGVGPGPGEQSILCKSTSIADFILLKLPLLQKLFLSYFSII